jgi:hypothetical protein
MDFPKQNIPDNKKNKEWHLDCINAVQRYHKSWNTFVDSRKKDHENYLIVAGEFDHKQYEYVTDMYGMTSPARFVNYPIIISKLDLLAGELVSQPLQFSVNVVNRNAIRKKNEEKINVAAEVVLRPIRREIEKVLGAPIPDENVGQEVPENVELYKKKKFRTAVEEMVHIGLTYCIQKWDLKSVFKRGFYDLSICGKEFYYTYIKNGDPYVERVDPRSMIYDVDIDKENLEDAKYVGQDNWKTVNEIIDQYGHKLDKKDVDKLEELQSNNLQGFENGSDIWDNYSHDESSNLKVRVIHLQWKSIKMIKHKVSENPYDPDNPYLKKLPDDYKPKKNENIVVKPITDIRQATKIGHDMLIDWGRKPNQIRYEENFANTSFDYFGFIRNNFNGTTLSVVDTLKNIQILYNITMYQIELAMSRAGGKAIVYDVSQKPKNIPLEDVFYHAKNTGLILINNKAEGMQSSSFNQFQQVDFTLSQSVSQMVNLKMMLEDTADKLTGISAARSGVQKSGDLVGVTERNVMQSTLITAPLFDGHYELVGDVLQNLAGLFKFAWGKEDRMINVFGDMGIQTFKIDKSIALDEYGIFVENSGKEVQRKQTMMSLLERYSSTGAIDPTAAIKAVNAESSSQIESILTEGLEAIREQMAQLEERKVAASEQANEIEAQKMSIPLEVAKIKSQTDLEVKRMDLTGKADIQSNDLEHKENMMQEQRNNDLDRMMLEDSNVEPERQQQVENNNSK